MVAAAGNAGPKSPPLYPAANANVIAVSATDAQDKLFAASNRGGHIAVAAPGVDIFLPAPNEKYQMTSGTSFSAAFTSGVAALMLERNPALNPAEVRAILMKTARDLGSPGRDDLFGAGEADAFAAVSAVVTAPAAPIAAVSGAPAAEKTQDRQDVPSTRDLSPPGAAMASDKAAVREAHRPAAQLPAPSPWGNLFANLTSFDELGCYSLRYPAEWFARSPDTVEDYGQLARQGYPCLA
jgi:subtilisin family serine protease